VGRGLWIAFRLPFHLSRLTFHVSLFKLNTQYSVLSSIFLITLLLTSSPPLCAEAPDDIIVEKNLFSPERKKWVMEEPKAKSADQEKVKKEIADISLYGTAISGGERYAVLRSKKGDKKDANKPYMVGDYVSGFLVKEIDTKRVVLRDESDAKEYLIYMNDENKDKSVERTAEKTEIKMPEPPEASDNATAAGAKGKRKPPRPRPAENTDMLKKKVQKSLDILKSNKSDLVRKQAERDITKLEKMLPTFTDQDMQDLTRMKQELEKSK